MADNYTYDRIGNLIGDKQTAYLEGKVSTENNILHIKAGELEISKGAIILPIL
jgi:hypothetical protein